MLSGLGTVFKALILLLCVANVVLQLYEILFRGAAHWVSLGLFMYFAFAIVLLLLNSVALLLPGNRTIPTMSYLMITAGFVLFARFPHRIVMF